MNDEQEHICEHEGCTNPGNPCWLPDSPSDGMPDYYYCGDHAHDECFCPGCGLFWGGIESFDFRLNGTDFCENCYSEFNDYEDDDLDFGWDYPEYEDLLADESGGRYIGEGSEYMPDESEETE